MAAMSLNTEHLLGTAATLEQALIAIRKETDANSVMYDLYRNAAIKCFELSLESCRKAHDYGVAFANETMALLPNYLHDVRVLAASIQKVFDDAKN
jgi:hypothetical protein